MNGRIILQDLGTHLYLAASDSWVESCQQARLFDHTYLALLEGLDQRDKTLQVVWCFQNPSLNMYLPVHPLDSDRIFPCISCPLAEAQGCPVREAVAA